VERFVGVQLRKFVIAFVAILVAMTGARWAVVFFVDPLARFNIDMDNITLFREREGKPWLIKLYPHNAILLGTSKLAYVNPDDIDTPDLKFFNSSFAGALPEEMYTFLKHFVPDSKLVVLSFDIIPMNENTWAMRREGNWQSPPFKIAVVNWFDYLNNNREALLLALEYTWKGKPNPGTLHRNGARNIPHEISRSEAMSAPAFTGPLAILRGAAFRDFKYSAQRIDYLVKIKALLDERRIPHLVLISPENRQMLDMIKASGNQWALDRFRSDVHRVFPGTIDYSNSWVSADENFLKFDPLHYLPDVGARMIREALRSLSAG
jgi:hypothetical protein